MTKQNIFEKFGNYLIFKGNVGVISFGFLLLVAEFVYGQIFTVISHIVCSLNLKCPISVFLVANTSIAFCYLYGIAISARLRNLKLNPSLTYFFVFLLWNIHYFAAHIRSIPIYLRVEYSIILIFFVLLPLFAKDKKVLQFWRSEKQ